MNLHGFKHICKPSNINVLFITAGQHISPEVIVKGFKKCSISNAMDGTAYGVVCNGSEEDGNVRRVCEEDEGID